MEGQCKRTREGGRETCTRFTLMIDKGRRFTKGFGNINRELILEFYSKVLSYESYNLVSRR